MLAGIGALAAFANEAELSTEGCGLLVDSCSRNLINISEKDCVVKSNTQILMRLLYSI